MLVEQYIEVETPKKIVKPVSQARFSSNYDIANLLTKFGNWARMGVYLKQNTPYYYHSQPKKLKEICSDDDALLINDGLLDLLNLNIKNSGLIYDILILYYFGERQIVKDIIYNDGSVRKEFARVAQEIQGPANIKKLSKNILNNNVNVIKRLSISEIAKKKGVSWDKAGEYKKSGEDFLVGYIAAKKTNKK